VKTKYASFALAQIHQTPVVVVSLLSKYTPKHLLTNTHQTAFSVSKSVQSPYRKEWTAEGTSLIWLEDVDMPVSESSTPVSKSPLVLNIASTSSSSIMTFPTLHITNFPLNTGLNVTNSSKSSPLINNASTPTWTGALPLNTSFAPYMNANATSAIGTGGIVIGSISTTITAQLQGWNLSSTAASETGVVTTKTIPIPSDRIPTASLVPPPTSTVSNAKGTGSSTVNFALFGLVLLGAVFVTL
jgi:hypothetical protein